MELTDEIYVTHTHTHTHIPENGIFSTCARFLVCSCVDLKTFRYSSTVAPSSILYPQTCLYSRVFSALTSSQISFPRFSVLRHTMHATPVPVQDPSDVLTYRATTDRTRQSGHTPDKEVTRQSMYVYRIIEARSCNHCCSGEVLHIVGVCL